MEQVFQIDFGAQRQSRVVGIDLGTTNSLVACMDLTGPKVIPGEDGENLTPSVVSLTPAGEILVGNAARRALITAPGRTVYSVKRLMGRGVADVSDELKLFPFRIAEGSESVIRLELGERTFTPPEISALILRQLKKNAEAHLGEPVSQAVITVPAYFNDAQRQATKDAGRIAGQVLATNGDTHLGGDDIDNLLLRIALEDIASEWDEDLSSNGEAVQTLRLAVIEAKERLSFAPVARLELAWRGRKYQRELTRELFEKLIQPIVDRTLGPCRNCMSDAGVKPEQIEEVVLVGGSTRIPLVRAAVERLFRAKPHTELNPDEVVALGAAVQAGILAGEVGDKLLLDVTPLSLGIETMGGVVSKLIHRNSTIPASAHEIFTTAVDGQRNVLIHVVQGERELTRDCRSLARFDLKQIDPLPAGMARIEVRFLIDANGILNVTARDTRTGKEHSVEVKPSYGLTDEQVEAMIEESIGRAEEDFLARQVREARVEADTILAAVDKAKQNDAWFDLAGAERSQIDTAVNRLLLAYHADDHLLIRAEIERLNTVTMKLAENMMNTAVRGALKGTKI
ncbi:MAG: Hsp70 family protein [Acidobacteria bacterium]|nr:Hsp70 family protein [Acidobacteriota bacterium]